LSHGNSDTNSFRLKEYELDSTTSTFIYFIGKQNIYYLYTVNEHGKIKKVDASIEKIKTLIKDLNNALATKTDHYYDLSYELYRLLWPESEKQLAFNLLILPDRMLYQIPFEALITEKIDSMQFLIHQHSIVYNYTLFESTKFKNKEQEVILAKNTFIHNGFKDDPKFSYIPLENNPVSYLDNYRLDIKTDKIGLKKLFLEALETNDLIHLTSHGEFNDNKIQVFFENNEVLKVSDIEKVNCNNQLVMINSCESALGEKDKIEGTLNFAYVLQYAGCPNISVNLWKSNSNTSQKILANFLSGLQSTYLSESLRKSKLEFLRDEETSKKMTHPYYWASSVLYGSSTTKFTLKKKSYLIPICITSLLFLLLLPFSFNLLKR